MESKCKCTFAQSLVGDGCEVCNPKYAIELLKEQNSTLIAEHKLMKEALENMEDAPLGFNFRLTAKETLKKLGR